MKFGQKESKHISWYLENDDICCKELETFVVSLDKNNAIQVDWENGYLLAVGAMNAVVLKYCPFCGEKIGRTKKHVRGSPGKTLKGVIDL